MIELPKALRGLSDYKQFIIWKPSPDGVRILKKPLDPKTGNIHNPHDFKIWCSSNDAIQYLKTFPSDYGLGFVFTDYDPFFFIDIDKCLLPNGKWSQVAIDICNRFNGNAVEISQSGKGIHIFGTGSPKPHGCKDNLAGLEFYHTKRFVALTGVNTVGDVKSYAPPGALDWLISTYSGLSVPTNDVATSWTIKPVDEWNGPSDNTLLITKMLASTSAASAFGGKATVKQLWDADPETLNGFYPDDIGKQGRPFDWSSADAALCAHLAWWTGKNCERIDELMRLSGLNRPKWVNRQDYRQNTILRAVGGCRGVYSSNPKAVIVTKPTKPTEDPGPEFKTGFQYMSPDQQAGYFKNCVYIQCLHRVFTPDGMLLRSEQFKATYGGYVFAIDSSNDKTTKNAFEAFTESQAIKFPKVNNLVFRPELPMNEIVYEEGLKLLNSYVPIKIDREVGDATPFLDLIDRLFPDRDDKSIIIAYMSACAQYPGKKFQWAPLIQGCEGNGKSLLLTAVSKAVGIRYTHKPPANDISNVFNAWITGKLFIAVEEVYVNSNREVMNALKTLITDDRVPVTPKGIDQMTGDNRANFMCTSNHKNAIKVARRNNRRWAIFYTPQQSYDDIVRDEMHGDYFPKLYGWFKNRGHAIVSEYLHSYRIPDYLNPATLSHRAPKTSNSAEIKIATLGGIEQDMIEAIEEGKFGFANGWISSMAVSKLLERRRINHSTRNNMITELGYIPHPGIEGGRVHTSIPIEGGKPRLYIKPDSPHLSLTKSSDIIAQYLHDQGLLK